MGLNETMAEIAGKPAKELTYGDVRDAYIYYLRIDFEPVGIRFCFDAKRDRQVSCECRKPKPSSPIASISPWPEKWAQGHVYGTGTALMRKCRAGLRVPGA